MKMTFSVYALALAALVLTPTALHGQVPQLINYQGRVAVGATNFDGAGRFKFALVDATGSTSYWSNDGSSVSGAEPAGFVPLTVSKGLYFVLLGDTTIAGMTAVPASVFTNADVRLRVWFDDGTNGSQLLSPDQRIAAVGFAMIAAGVNLPATTGATAGVIMQNGGSLLHTFGSENFFAGSGAGNFSMTGDGNTASGDQALASNTTGDNNAASGRQALYSNTTGRENTASGRQALYSNTTGIFNSASGHQALYLNTTGQGNVAVGMSALRANTTGWYNAASGSSALAANTTGDYNSASGNAALFNNTTGGSNVAVGAFSLYNSTGNSNIGIGNNAGEFLTTGSDNIYIANGGFAVESGTIHIGRAGFQTSAYMAGIHGFGEGGLPVYISSAGKLGTLASSRRFKENIADMNAASEALLSLRPVTFRYKPERDPHGIPQFGLIAEDVDAIASDLVARDDKGEIYTVRYDAVNAMLLNEFLKDHRRADARDIEIAALRGKIAERDARDKERDARDKERDARIARLESLLPAVPAQPVAIQRETDP